MKKEIDTLPSALKEEYPNQFSSFSWMDFVTAIPSPIFLVTTYKKGNIPNATLQSWSTFVGSSGEFICILGSVSKGGHLYQTLMEEKVCVLNFPSSDYYKKCEATILHNKEDDDEITSAGLTVEPAVKIHAPRIKECFLNLECELLWAKDHFEGATDTTVCLKVCHLSMDDAYYNEAKLGRYGEKGYIYNIHSPMNPDTGENFGTCLGAIQPYGGQ